MKKQKFGGADQYTVSDTNSSFSVSFLPARGAILNEFTGDVNGQSVSVIDGYSDEDDLIRNHEVAFRSAKLSPYPNRIRGGEYEFEGKKYKLNCNFPKEGNSIHGLVYNKSFNAVKAECDGEKACLMFSFNYDGSEPGYPFKYNLAVEYVVERNKLSCKTIIVNADERRIPAGDGWHPYFTTGNRIDDLELVLPESLILSQEKMIPTGETEHFERHLFSERIGSHHFDNCFQICSSGSKAVIELADPQNNTRLNIWQETGKNKYNYFQLYTPPSRSSIAVEPMTSPPDAFNSKKDLLLLEPGEKQILSWGFGLSAR